MLCSRISNTVRALSGREKKKEEEEEEERKNGAAYCRINYTKPQVGRGGRTPSFGRCSSSTSNTQFSFLLYRSIKSQTAAQHSLCIAIFEGTEEEYFFLSFFSFLFPLFAHKSAPQFTLTTKVYFAVKKWVVFFEKTPKNDQKADSS
eukprot:TRINITY_DN1206_c0_g1_i1.p1 TRINITY_DN1206_c0_g1~~TRINITY_DN1206_c0_g1_i1.p1  ORF type:complete len:147 (-),score=9.50 TRINITY_DN1206_c0_g1_i1:318-758(-)